MFRTHKILSLFGRARRDEVTESLRLGVDHRNLTLGDPGNEQVVLEPDADHGVLSHEVTLKAPADDLRSAARYMRTSLCYGGSADEFYSTIAEWWEREAGQAEREVTPGFLGEPDDLAVRSARAYLPGARVSLQGGDLRSRTPQTTTSGVNAEQADLPHGTDDVPVEAKDYPSCSTGGSTFGEASA